MMSRRFVIGAGCLASTLFSSLLFCAESETSLAGVVRQVRAQQGICVQIGGDRSLPAELANEALLVHALLPREEDVQAARELAARRRLAGRVTIERWTSAELPYADNLINVAVVAEAAAVSGEEIRRVLVPRGVAWVQSGSGWTPLAKPWPKEFDEWTHWRHGADGNMVSHDLAVGTPTGLRWVAGPAQDSGGRKWYNDNVMVSAQGRNFYLHDDSVTARDAFNGALLWRKPLRPYLFSEIGTEVPDFITLLTPKVRRAVRTSKVRPVAWMDRLYLAADGVLMALDAATGQRVAEYAPLVHPREILCDGERVIVSETNRVRAFEAKSPRLLWEIPLDAERMVIGDARLLCMTDTAITCFDLASGRQRWRTADPAIAPATTCTYHRGLLVLETSSWRDDPNGCEIRVYAADTGRLLWRRGHRPDQTHFQEMRAFFAQDLLWLQAAGNRVVGYDPMTGDVKKTWRSRGKHCATPVATERFFIAPECEFTDLATGDQARARMFKSACRLPFIPANGLLHTFPVQCECFPMLRGYMGLTGSPWPPRAETPRLETGPAYQQVTSASMAVDSAADWPMYRHDVFRSGSSPVGLRENATRKWMAEVALSSPSALTAEWADNPFVKGALTPPVVAAGLAIVAVPDEHRVVALDAATGETRWSFMAGGRIDSPPTLAEGQCLFGSHDGWIYCLSLADGALAWRYRAAPQEARISAYGQLESPWPVPGSVLVDEELVYTTAGRHPFSDGGVRVLALEPRTGKVRWEKIVSQFALTNWYGMMLTTNSKVGVDFEPVDLPVRDGNSIGMSRWRFDPNNGDYALHLGSTEYAAHGLKVPRGLWSYGIRQTKSVAARPPAAFNDTLHRGTTNDLAVIVAGDVVLTASRDATIRSGTRRWKLDEPAIPDGLAVARGRLYVATQAGQVICFE